MDNNPLRVTGPSELRFPAGSELRFGLAPLVWSWAITRLSRSLHLLDALRLADPPGWHYPSSRREEGAVAQLGERLLCKQQVTGSIPVRSMSEVEAPPSLVTCGASRRRAPSSRSRSTPSAGRRLGWRMVQLVNGYAGVPVLHECVEVRPRPESRLHLQSIQQRWDSVAGDRFDDAQSDPQSNLRPGGLIAPCQYFAVDVPVASRHGPTIAPEPIDDCFVLVGILLVQGASYPWHHQLSVLNPTTCAAHCAMERASADASEHSQSRRSFFDQEEPGASWG
jgi:hypothetical protein